MNNDDSATTARVRLVRPRDAAEALGVSRGLIYRLAAQGKIRTVRIGAAIRVPELEIERVSQEGTSE